jgi:hypothetical protein
MKSTRPVTQRGDGNVRLIQIRLAEHRADAVAILAHWHHRTRLTWFGPRSADNGDECDLLTLGLPAFDTIENVPHDHHLTWFASDH